jgi:hypothetical protein
MDLVGVASALLLERSTTTRMIPLAPSAGVSDPSGVEPGPRLRGTMRSNLRNCAVLASILLLGACQSDATAPLLGPIITDGPELTFRGTVRSSTGAPVSGARVRLYAPGEPFEFPYTVVSGETTVGGSYLLRLPAELSLGDACGVWRLSARAIGFESTEGVQGLLCVTAAQEFDFVLTPVGN